MALATLAELGACLEAEGAAPRAREDGETLEVPTRVEGVEGRLLVRWPAGAPLVQVVHVVPELAVPAEARAAVEHTIVRVNHDLVCAGFGLDEEGGRVYFRATVFCDPTGLSFEVFAMQVEVALAAVRRFRPLFVAVAAGSLDVDAALAEARGARGYPLPID